MPSDVEYFCDQQSIRNIRARLTSTSVNADKLAVLTLSGSFNPIHTQHVRALEITKRHIQHLGFNVAAAFLAPSSDKYVSQKMSTAALSFAHRRTLCQLAVRRSPWINVCSRGEMSSNWVRRTVQKELEQNLFDILHGRRLQSIEIMGSETVVKILEAILSQTGAKSARSTQFGRKICWFLRAGPDSRAEKGYIETSLIPRAAKLGIGLALVEPTQWGPPLEAISSTAIRDLVSRGDWKTLRANNWLEPEVARKLEFWVQSRARHMPFWVTP